MNYTVLAFACLFGFNYGSVQHQFYFNTSVFAEIITRPTFVDKTLLIKTFFQEANQVLITAPNNFGKSTNMDMLKTFLKITVDDNGLPVVEHISANCMLFKHHNLNIYQDEQFFYKHCGQYPVILIDFKAVGGDTYRNVLDRFRSVLHSAFRQHGYLLNLSESLKAQFNLYYGESFSDLTETDILWGFRFLSELLNKHFTKEVFILIDNYDYPTLHVEFDKDSDDRKTVRFIRDLMSYLLKCNPHVDRALLNSCHAPTQSLFVGITNIELFAFADDHNFAQFYGFTDSEVYALAERFNVEEEFEEIQNCCDEYHVRGRKFKVYSSWSVVCYLQLKS